MSDSSWQHSVLRDLGVSQRGLATLEAPDSPSSSEWGAESPPPAEAALPHMQAIPEPVAETEAAGSYDPFSDPGQPPASGSFDPAAGSFDPAAGSYDPAAGSFDPAGGSYDPAGGAYDPAGGSFQPAAAGSYNPAAGTYDPASGQQPPGAGSYDPFGGDQGDQQPQPQQPQPQPQAGAPDQGGSGSYDPFGDDQQQSAPLLTPEEQQAAAPLVNEEFSWDAAISPLMGAGGAQAPGMAQAPGAEDDEDEYDDGRYGGVIGGQGSGGAPSAPMPSPSQQGSGPQPVAPQPHHPQQDQQPGGVPMANEFVRKDQHGDPLMRRIGRGARKAVGASGSNRLKTQAEIVELLQRRVASYRQIAVASVRGGAGKTTMAALLSTELARHRSDRVLAMDADAELGSLPLRLGTRSELSLFDLAGRQPRTFEEAARYLMQTNEGLWVLSSSRGGRIAGEVTLDVFEAALSAVSRYMAAAVVDCGAGILTDLHQGILANSHSLVLVTPGTADGALSARGALEWFVNSNRRSLLSRTVIAMVMHAPQVGADVDRAAQMLGAWGLPVVQVPFDRHVAAGAALDVTKIGEATRLAVDRIAYEAFGRSLGVAGVAR
ncbi:hypothetical protein J4573_45085 [Actinomadura barringtoniae]|uniref:CobQ/CobB/MinD/ParA nucleotide binding domain-containing protein n=1 Tax=Actinomadura barringtoniae TaxID=1427535 RepID=A0A939T8N3_9ACTN|nr:AAA family ATPase [Actinomadura barringtoniae]MBO2454328.1 hypothetical protein [Actinomadura barringtoniae]